MSRTGTDQTLSSGAVPAAGQHPSRRRQIVVDPRYQLRAGVLVGVVALVLLMLLNASLIVPHHPAASSETPATSTFSIGQNGISWTLVILGSVALVVGVTLIGVLESHRTAGASYAIRRAVDELREGRAGVRVRLRRGDHLQDLAQAINRLAEQVDAERGQRE